MNKKLLSLLFLSAFAAESLHAYSYKFTNKTSEAYDIEINLACANDNKLSGKLEPDKTLTLNPSALNIGCCISNITIKPFGTAKKIIIGYSFLGCGSVDLFVTKNPDEGYKVKYESKFFGTSSGLKDFKPDVTRIVSA